MDGCYIISVYELVCGRSGYGVCKVNGRVLFSCVKIWYVDYWYDGIGKFVRFIGNILFLFLKLCIV